MIKRILTIQLCFTTIFVIIAMFIAGVDSIISAIAGCFCCIIPCFYFYTKAHRAKKHSDPQSFIAAFYVAEAVKFLLTICCFIIVFAGNIINNPIVFFVGFIQAQFAVWLLPFFEKKLFDNSS